jgi:deoxyribose-phosphate aldolase
VERCVKNLKGSNVLVSCTVGFHEGTYRTAEKVKYVCLCYMYFCQNIDFHFSTFIVSIPIFSTSPLLSPLTLPSEALQAVSLGAPELDMVMNYPLLKAGDIVGVQADVEAVRKACPAPTVLKVIVETSQLNVEQIAKACEIVVAAKADFIKTSTGFNGRGASVEDVQIMRYGVGDKAKVKASGGVKTVKDAIKIIEAGADRIGASAGVGIMEEAKKGGSGLGGEGKGDGGY